MNGWESDRPGAVQVASLRDTYRAGVAFDPGEQVQAHAAAMMTRPFSALCAHDRVGLGAAAVTQLACLHPAVTEGVAPFRLFATPDATAALAGELELFGVALFRGVVRRAGLTPAEGELGLRTSHYIPRRLAGLFGTGGLRVEQMA